MHINHLWTALNTKSPIYFYIDKIIYGGIKEVPPCPFYPIDYCQKNLFEKTGYSAYEYECTYHLIGIKNSYYPSTVPLYAVWAFVVIAPYWKERG